LWVKQTRFIMTHDDIHQPVTASLEDRVRLREHV
jgi:hypothetical protein